MTNQIVNFVFYRHLNSANKIDRIELHSVLFHNKRGFGLHLETEAQPSNQTW